MANAIDVILPGKGLFLKGLLPALLIGVLVGCESPTDIPTERRTDSPKSFLGALDDVGTPGEQVILWQNWDDDKRQEFWFTPQGSQIIPYDWVSALEQPDSKNLFFENGHMDRLRYIPQSPTERNPDGLPIGFTKDLVWYSKNSRLLERLEYEDHGNPVYQEISNEWLGLTCAACHTNQIEHKGKKIVVDGAPAMADFEGLMKGLVESMEATLGDDDKFDRFAKKVFDLGNAKAKSNDELKTHLARIIDIRKAWNTRNSGDGLEYGFARLDAINSILNEVSSTALGIKSNRVPANAPVSYPFIWDAPHHDFIQWNGMVKNDAPGALGRNAGEVLGVFGSLELKPPADPDDIIQLTGYESSVRVPNLGKLEHLLISLWSPLWPDSVLPPVNKKLAEVGQGHFEKRCAACHKAIEPESPSRRIKSHPLPAEKVGTDPATAEIFFKRMAKTGPLKGQYKRYRPPGKKKDDCPVGDPNEKFTKDAAAAAKFLGHAVAGTLAHDKSTVLKIVLKTNRHVPQDIKTCPPIKPSYKARPLNGIWATAPYLHNGSVPTLWQLLRPKDRRKTFHVGSREFDHKEVGFKYDESDYGPNDPKFRFNTKLKGNLNTGHTYGKKFFQDPTKDPDEKLTKGEKRTWALIEYLKKL